MTTINNRLYAAVTAHLFEIVNLHTPVHLTESPIEAALLHAIYLFTLVEYRSFPNKLGAVQCEFQITPQFQIGRHRVDFLVTSPLCNQKLVVECDGHDFHERTKEQAAHDRSRDREMTAAGYRVLRFTGSEIWADPWGCAKQIRDQVYDASIQEQRLLDQNQSDLARFGVKA